MRAYIIRRVLLIIPTMFLVTVIVFCSIRLIPGSVVDLMVSEMGAESGMGTKLTTEYVRHQLGMDIPIHISYGRWVRDALRGDLGKSLWTNRDVTEDLMTKLPVSFEVGLIALVTALLIALPTGVYSAIRQDTLGDYAGRTIAILSLSLPSFWIATMVMVYPSIWLNWSPPLKYVPFVDDPVANLAQFALPGVILGMSLTGTTMRMTRTMMLEVLRQDYIRTAWSKGLRERTVVLRHALRNALIPVVSMIGLLLPMLVAGSVVLEQIFVLPGIGMLLLESIQKRDYPVICGISLMVAGFVLVVNLLVDLTYAYLDPRVHYR